LRDKRGDRRSVSDVQRSMAEQQRYAKIIIDQES
jgi:hypothetical protein